MLPPFAVAAAMLTQRVEEDIDKFIEQHGQDKVIEEGKVSQFTVPVDHVGQYRLLCRKQADSGIFMGMLPKMSLVSLVSIYDVYLARLVRAMYRAKPEMLSGSNRQLTYTELSGFASLEDARDHILELEIDSLLRDSHTAQFEWLEGKLGIPLRKKLAAWPIFVEVTERRNLFVHTDGTVNAQYIAICKKAGAKLEEGCTTTTVLRVKPEYFSTACNAVAEIGVKLSQVIWRKLLPEDINSADSSLIDISYELLLQRNFDLAETILQFATKSPFKYACAENGLYLKVNLAIALKAQSKSEQCSKILDDIDWSALSDLFRIAAASLREEFDEAAAIMRRIGPEGKPNKAAYQDWPLFHWFRKSEQFKAAYQDVFGEPYRIRRADVDPEKDDRQQRAITGDATQQQVQTDGPALGTKDEK